MVTSIKKVEDENEVCPILILFICAFFFDFVLHFMLSQRLFALFLV